MTDTRKISSSVIASALRVMREAMEITSERYAGVVFYYSGHTASLTVGASPADADRPVRDCDMLLDRTVYLDRDDSEEKLMQLVREVSALRKTAKA